MSTIKVSIKDSTTLELQEDARKGDIIDLSNLSSANVSSVADAIMIQARKNVSEELEKAKEKEIEAELLKQEKKLLDEHNKQLESERVDKNKYVSILEKKELEIEQLRKEQIQLSESEKLARESAVIKSTAEMEKRILELSAELEKKDDVLKLELERKENQIVSLNSKMKHQEESRALETKRILQDIENEKEKLASALDSKNNEHKVAKQEIERNFQIQLKDKDDEISRLKDMKIKQSVKILGESLEQHCETVFNQMRSSFPSGFKNVYFGKDNDSKQGELYTILAKTT